MLTFSPIYASLLVALILFLAYRVVTFRRGEGVSLGDEKGSAAMKRAVRAHANAVENIPAALILLVLLELNHLNPWIFHVFGIVLVVARVLHAWGLSRANGPSFGRFYGTALTWLCMAGMAVVNILVVVTR